MTSVAPSESARATDQARGRATVSEFHDLTMNAITGDPVSFEQYKGGACLVVNLASQ